VFERFTNRARQALVLAEQEARSLNQSVVGTEHLLLGLAGEPEGVGGKVLRSFGLSVEDLRADAEQQRTTDPPWAVPVQPAFSPQAKRALECSLQESVMLGHNYIGTEHLLLGLAREREGKSADVLTRRRISSEELRRRVLEHLMRIHAALAPASTLGASPTPSEVTMKARDPSEEQSPALAHVMAKATDRAGRPTTTTDVVLAILDEASAQATIALSALGVTRESFRHAVSRVPAQGTGDASPRSTGTGVEHGESTTLLDDPELPVVLGRTIVGILRRLMQAPPQPPAEDNPA
jgi:ATP-dependent Clp protease ATP-binding subunit ClpC